MYVEVVLLILYEQLSMSWTCQIYCDPLKRLRADIDL